MHARNTTTVPLCGTLDADTSQRARYVGDVGTRCDPATGWGAMQKGLE